MFLREREGGGMCLQYLYSWLSSKSGLQSSQLEDAVISYKVAQQ